MSALISRTPGHAYVLADKDYLSNPPFDPARGKLPRLKGHGRGEVIAGEWRVIVIEQPDNLTPRSARALPRRVSNITIKPLTFETRRAVRGSLYQEQASSS